VLAALLGVACSRQPDPPPKPLPPPLEYLGQWGVPGDGPGQLNRPVSIATDALGKVYIADAGRGVAFIHKFDREGHPLLSFVPGEDAQSPCSIAVDRGGAIYLGDCHSGSLSIFYPDGSPLRSIRRGPSGRWQGPEGLAVDDEGNIFVVESRADRIAKLSPSGRVVKTWGKRGSGPGEFSGPSKVAVGPDGNLYVADIMGHRIQKFTRDGVYLAAWDCPFTKGTPLGGSAVYGLAVSEKYVIVSDSRNAKAGKPFVRFWALDGEPKLTETFANRPELQPPPVPADVAVSPRGELLVLDAAGPRVLRFRINL
jgi:DNA-binding beta-propeller fold protein YncE